MDSMTYIKQYLDNSLEARKRLNQDEELLEQIESVSKLIVQAYGKGKKVLIAGNGGSAGDAQHIAAEFVSRFLYDRPGLPAIALTTDSSMLTAIGNDYGFERLFSRQVQAQGMEGDIFIGISTSGNSKNIIAAVVEAKKKGITTVALCGSGGELPSIVDIALQVPSDSTPYIQESHICIGHVICAYVEDQIFPRD